MQLVVYLKPGSLLSERPQASGQVSLVAIGLALDRPWCQEGQPSWDHQVHFACQEFLIAELERRVKLSH